MISDKYLFTYWGNGTNRYLFRMDKEGTILRADIHGAVYYPIALSDVPQPVIYNFRDGARLTWQERVVDSGEVPPWGRAENATDTGLTDEEFIALVLERIPTAKYENYTFYVRIERNNVWTYKRMSNHMLQHFAKNNKYFGNMYFMED